jgi:hypothetical protein
LTRTYTSGIAVGTSARGGAATGAPKRAHLQVGVGIVESRTRRINPRLLLGAVDLAAGPIYK